MHCKDEMTLKLGEVTAAATAYTWCLKQGLKPSWD